MVVYRTTCRMALAASMFLACFVLVSMSCSDDDENPVNGDSKYLELVWQMTEYDITVDTLAGTDEIMPLSVGSFWKGSFEQYDQSGNVIEDGIFSILVERDTAIDNQAWYILAGTENLFSNREDGLWAMYGYADGRTLQDPVLHSKFPATTEDTYQSGDTLVATVTVISTDTLITVPGGEYHCFLYEWDRPTESGSITISLRRTSVGSCMSFTPSNRRCRSHDS